MIREKGEVKSIIYWGENEDKEESYLKHTQNLMALIVSHRLHQHDKEYDIAPSELKSAVVGFACPSPSSTGGTTNKQRAAVNSSGTCRLPRIFYTSLQLPDLALELTSIIPGKSPNIPLKGQRCHPKSSGEKVKLKNTEQRCFYWSTSKVSYTPHVHVVGVRESWHWYMSQRCTQRTQQPA